MTPDQHLDAWQRSGTSARAYAELHGLKPSSLYSWRRRARADGSTQRLLPVVVATSCACEVAFPDGRTLRFPESLHADALRLFLKAMERA